MGDDPGYRKGVKDEVFRATVPIRNELARRETWGQRFDAWALGLINRVLPPSGNTRRIDYDAFAKELKPLVPVLPSEEEIGAMIAAGDKKLLAALRCREKTEACGRAHAVVGIGALNFVGQLAFRGKQVFSAANEGSLGKGPSRSKPETLGWPSDSDRQSSRGGVEASRAGFGELVSALHQLPLDAQLRAAAFATGAGRIADASGGGWSIRAKGRAGDDYWFEGGEGEVFVVSAGGVMSRGGSDLSLRREGGFVTVDHASLTPLLVPGPTAKMIQAAVEVANRHPAQGPAGRLAITERLLRQIPTMRDVEPVFQRESESFYWTSAFGHVVRLFPDGRVESGGL